MVLKYHWIPINFAVLNELLVQYIQVGRMSAEENEEVYASNQYLQCFDFWCLIQRSITF